jgi:hypothetical protein
MDGNLDPTFGSGGVVLTSMSYRPNAAADGDVNGDGIVDSQALLIVQENYGHTIGGPPWPPLGSSATQVMVRNLIAAIAAAVWGSTARGRRVKHGNVTSSNSTNVPSKSAPEGHLGPLVVASHRRWTLISSRFWRG